jgi:2-keto-4-pentenoate hydratase/2-oxohepta-3-ene-1,7-dioic acid hydratase in catechol pathway
MRLATFDDGRGARAGAVVPVDAAARADAGLAIADVTAQSDWPRALRDWLPRLPEQRDALLAAVAGAPRLPLADVELLPPIPDPGRFYAVGLNYADHAREMGVPLPKQPRLFVKLPGTVQRPYGPIVHPGHSDTLDYEGELAFVVGRRCRDVPAARAREYIAGYLIVDDLSLREFVNPDTLVVAKGCDTFAPQGPWLTTADEVPDPRALRIRTWVDGELRQDGRTAELVYGPDELLAWCSRGITLEPGDVVTTGSPPGSGHGYAPPRYLRAGQRVRIEIDGLGAIENVVTTR